MENKKIPTGTDGFAGLKSLMERLRGGGGGGGGSNGCPWDMEQTIESLAPFIIEEAYEVVSAIDSGVAEDIKEELGDLLFQVIFVSRIAEEEGKFTVEDVIKTLIEKMVRRHPHVFGDKFAETPEEVLVHWAEVKKAEKKGGSALSGVPEAMPALLRAHKISKKAARSGFDWKHIDGVLEKVREELSEFSEAIQSKDPEKVEEELGDLLFTIVNAARFLEVSPEEALRKTIGKFITRFHHIESSLSEAGSALSTTPMEKLEALWEEAKRKGKKIIEQKQKG
ncbi:MAG: nucleoside triphosphate pyrophosphohydrolase [Thermodesulfobacteriota bacterium]